MKVKHIPYEMDEEDSQSYHEHYWKVRSLELLVNEVKTPHGLKLLDYGSGRGEFLTMAKDAGFDVSGVDMDEKCVELSRRFGPAELVDPEDCLESFPADSVDIVSSTHVLEHVENPKRLLQNMCRVARKYVLVTVPNLERFRNWGAYDLIVNEGHLHGWDKETLNNLATFHCGLELVGFSSDMTKVPSVSYRIGKFLGPRAEKAINLKVFSRLWPRKSLSIIALYRVPS